METTSRIARGAKGMILICQLVLGMAWAGLANAVPFTFVLATIDTGGGNPVETFVYKLHPTFAEVGFGGNQAKGRAAFGETGAFATSNGLGVFAETWWTDAFTISGGTGTGVITVNVVVEGSLIGERTSGGSGPNSIYALVVNDSPFTQVGLRLFLDDYEGVGIPNGIDGGTPVFFQEGFSGTNIFSFDVSFTYGETFYLASYFAAEVNGGDVRGTGTADFFNSSHFSGFAPDGSPIVGLSGTSFNFAAAQVPEPETALLMFAGLLPLMYARGKRKARGT